MRKLLCIHLTLYSLYWFRYYKGLGIISQKGLRPGVSLVQINKGLNSKNGLSCVLQKGGTLVF